MTHRNWRWALPFRFKTWSCCYHNFLPSRLPRLRRQRRVRALEDYVMEDPRRGCGETLIEGVTRAHRCLRSGRLFFRRVAGVLVISNVLLSLLAYCGYIGTLGIELFFSGSRQSFRQSYCACTRYRG